MARSRIIKPGFFLNDELAALPITGRMLFIGLWCLADREGRLEDRPRRIWGQIFPYDTAVDCDELLHGLSEHGFINRYEVGQAKYIQIINFIKHQQPHYKEIASVIPAPEGHVDSISTPGGVPNQVRNSVFERDGYKCVQCGANDNLAVDHIKPRAKGGSHDITNLQTLCKSCNSKKRDHYDANQSSADVEPTLSQGQTDESAPLPTSYLNLVTLDPLTLNHDPDPVISVPTNATAAENPEVGNVFRAAENVFGLLNSIQAQRIDEAIQEFTPQWVTAAIEETAIGPPNAHRWNYTVKILERWRTQGFKSPLPRSNGHGPTNEPGARPTNEREQQSLAKRGF